MEILADEDLRDIARLIALAETRRRDVALAARQELADKLQVLTAVQAGQVGEQNGRALRRLLVAARSPAEAGLVTAILRFAAMVGGVPFFAPVEALAASSKDDRIRAAAGEALRALERRQQKRRLLRPAVAPPVRQGPLLRPASPPTAPPQSPFKPLDALLRRRKRR